MPTSQTDYRSLAEVPSATTLDENIRAFIPEFHITAMLANHNAGFRRPTGTRLSLELNGHFADETIGLRAQPAVEELLTFLEAAYQGKRRQSVLDRDTVDIVRSGKSNPIWCVRFTERQAASKTTHRTIEFRYFATG